MQKMWALQQLTRPFGLGGVSLMVWRTFMSRMLWMYKLSSRATTKRALENYYGIMVKDKLETPQNFCTC